MADYSDEPVSDEEFKRQLQERKERQKTEKAATQASKHMASGGATDAVSRAAAKRSAIQSSWKTPTAPSPVKMAKGGSASARADGIASKGKTRGTIIAMCCGGKAKK